MGPGENPCEVCTGDRDDLHEKLTCHTQKWKNWDITVNDVLTKGIKDVIEEGC